MGLILFLQGRSDCQLRDYSEWNLSLLYLVNHCVTDQSLYCTNIPPWRRRKDIGYHLFHRPRSGDSTTRNPGEYAAGTISCKRIHFLAGRDLGSLW